MMWVDNEKNEASGYTFVQKRFMFEAEDDLKIIEEKFDEIVKKTIREHTRYVTMTNVRGGHWSWYQTGLR